MSGSGGVVFQTFKRELYLQRPQQEQASKRTLVADSFLSAARALARARALVLISTLFAEGTN